MLCLVLSHKRLGSQRILGDIHFGDPNVLKISPLSNNPDFIAPAGNTLNSCEIVGGSSIGVLASLSFSVPVPFDVIVSPFAALSLNHEGLRPIFVQALQNGLYGTNEAAAPASNRNFLTTPAGHSHFTVIALYCA